MTLPDVIKELKKRMRRALFDMQENCREKGDESIDFLWSKCKYETLEEVMWFINPKFDGEL